MRPPRNAQGVVRVIARGEGGRRAGQHDRAERAYGAEPSRAERVAHSERNAAAEGCIDPPAARSRRRRAAPRRSIPLAVLSLRRATPNPKRLPRFASTPMALSRSLSVTLARRSILPLSIPLRLAWPTPPRHPSRPAHVDCAAHGDISEPG